MNCMSVQTKPIHLQTFWGRSMHRLEISAMWSVRSCGGVLALGKVGGFTLGGLASFLTFNKSFSMPINQISMQMNAIVMAMAGADRIFKLMDEKEELDEGYVTLVNAKEEDGKLTECEERTKRWAWKHTQKMAVWIMWR